MPRLRVVAGPALDELVPISVNSGVPHNIVSDTFEGQILAYIKGFTDKEGNVLESEYFHREDRKGITWSIQVQGRFLRPISADDVLFGNTFDRPLKLPWGSGAALKFMHFVDPTLEHDLASSTKPWALSPFISTMPHLAHRRVPAATQSLPSPTIPQTAPHERQPTEHAINREAWPPFPPPRSLSDDTAQLHLSLSSPLPSYSPSPSPSPTPSSLHLCPPSSSGSGSVTPDSDSSVSTPVVELFDPDNASLVLSPGDSMDKKNRVSASSLALLLSSNHEGKREHKERKRTEKFVRALRELRTADRRRTYFRTPSHRQGLIFGPEDIFTIDFCYGFIQFTPTLSLQLPGGISFDLMHYWDGQPVRFVCCERKREVEGNEGDADSDVPWGRVLWCVAIELVPDEQPQPQPQRPAQSGSRTTNAVTNEAVCHHQPDDGDDGDDGHRGLGPCR